MSAKPTDIFQLVLIPISTTEGVNLGQISTVNNQNIFAGLTIIGTI